MSRTFISALVEPFSDQLNSILSILDQLVCSQGCVKVLPSKLHATVIYSDVELDANVVNIVLDQVNLPFSVNITRAACFDPLPRADGTRDPNLATIVLTIWSPQLEALHKACITLGGTHEYEYAPHISLWYDVPRDIAEVAVSKLNSVMLDYRLDALKQKLKATFVAFHVEAAAQPIIDAPSSPDDLRAELHLLEKRVRDLEDLMRPRVC